MSYFSIHLLIFKVRQKYLGYFVKSIFLFLIASQLVLANQLESLVLESQKPVTNMPLGNLSGITYCQNKWLVVSDKDDDHLYELKEKSTVYQAQKISLPPLPPLSKQINLSSLEQLHKKSSNHYLDFEGIACDQLQNIYLVSEFTNQVLQVNPDFATITWLHFPDNMLKEANQLGLLTKFNAKFEGIAVNEYGNQIWLTAERQNRGIIFLEKNKEQWRCKKNCVLLSEGYLSHSPKALGGKKSPVDFSDAFFWKNKLFTLERLTHQICRRNSININIEKCWSFASILLGKGMTYGNYPFGQAEALWLDENHAWIGIDNNQMKRDKDGESRPIIFRFKSPKNGWLN